MLAWIVLGLGVAVIGGSVGWHAAARKAEPARRRRLEALGELTLVGGILLIVLALILFDAEADRP